MKMPNKLINFMIVISLFVLSSYRLCAETDVDKSIGLLLKGNDREREYAAEFLGKLKLKKAVPFLKDKMANDQNWLVRLASVSSLNKLGEPYDTGIVEMALLNEDKLIRLKASWVLQGLSEWKNRDIILKLFKDEDVEVRRSIFIAAGKLKIKEAFDPLILMSKDPIPETREAAVISLGALDDRMVLDPLLKMLEDPSAKVVRAAVISLGEIGGEEILMPMIRMLGHKDKTVRYYAINILGELGEKSGYKAILGMVNDREAKVRLGAVSVLGKLKKKEYIPVFKERFTEGTDPYVKLEAAKGLILMEDYTGYDFIREEVFDKNTELKKGAVEILGMIKDKSSVPLLKDLFLFPNPEVKEAAIRALGEIGDAGVLNFLLKKLDEEKEFKIVIIDALKKYQDVRLIPHLSECLGNESYVVRKHAAVVLGGYSDAPPGVEKKLKDLLSDEYSDVRQAAMTTLVKLGKKVDVELLAVAKNNSDPLQMAAIAGLTELKNKEVIPVILSLYDSGIAGRYKLLLAYQLASFGDYRGKSLIIEMSKKEDYVLRKQAAEYSCKFVDPDIFAVLSILIKDSKKEVKLAAAKALGQMNDKRAVDILMNNLIVENLFLEAEIENSMVNLKDISIDPLINIIRKSITEGNVPQIERASSILVKTGISSFDKIIKVYETQDNNIKTGMMNILVRIGEDSLLPLISYWDGRFEQLNNILIDAIIKISMENPELLTGQLESETLQNKAAKLIPRLPANKVLDLLIDKFYVSSGMVKVKVIECLRSMSSAAADRLIKDLETTDEAKQLNIIELLGEIKAEKAVTALEKVIAETKNVKIKEIGTQVVNNLKNMQAAAGGGEKSQLEKLNKKRGKVTMAEKGFIFSDLGWKDNINVGMVFLVYDSQNKQIGRMEITEVVGNNTSIGKMRGEAKVEAGYVIEEDVKEAYTKEADLDEIKVQLERLKSGDLKIKSSAINILGDKGDEKVLPEIIYFLDDKNMKSISENASGDEQNELVNIRKNAVWAAGEIEYKTISKIYQDSGEKKVLAENEQEWLNKITDILVKFFTDPDSGVSLAAVRSITKLIMLRGAFGLKNDFIVDSLCNLLNSSDNYVQRAAVEAVAELKDPKSISFLVNIWNDDDATVRGNVAWALEKIGKPAVPALKEALKDTSDEKKRAAASVLYKLGYKVKRTGNNYEVSD